VRKRDIDKSFRHTQRHIYLKLKAREREREREREEK